MTPIYPVYWNLIEQDEAETREREEWIESLADKWGLVRYDRPCVGGDR